MPDRPLHEVVALATPEVERVVVENGRKSRAVFDITPALVAYVKAADDLRHASFEPDDGMSDWRALDAAYDTAAADLRRALEGK